MINLPFLKTAIAIVCTAAGLAIGMSVGQNRVNELKLQHAEFLQQITTQINANNEALRKAQENIREAHNAVQAATVEAERRNQVDAAAARTAGDRLRQRAEAIAARGCPAPRTAEPAGSGSAAEDPARMLADVLGRLEPFCRQLAAVADERGTAGAACEQSYDALK